MRLTSYEGIKPPASNLTDREFIRWARQTFPKQGTPVAALIARMESMLDRVVDDPHGECPSCGAVVTAED